MFNLNKDHSNNLMIVLISFLFFLFYSLITVRLAFVRQYYLYFMAWNLLLAYIPLVLSAIIVAMPRKFLVISFLIWIVWFFFYPNAPYIVTDLIHLNRFQFSVYSYSRESWLGFFYIVSGVFAGAVFGLLSLKMLHDQLHRQFGFLAGWVFVAGIFCASGVAITWGRFLRLNSWEVVTNPRSLIYTVISQFDREMVYMSIIFALLSFSIYCIFYLIQTKKY